MKIIIAGSRDFFDPELIDEVYNSLEDVKITEVVSGGARGADKAGEEWAYRCGIPIKRFPAQWDKYGKSAGYRRNAEMAEYADGLIAFWDGESKGTQHMIDIAKRELPFWHIEYYKENT